MKKKDPRFNRKLRNVLLYLSVTQALGIVGAIAVGSTMDSGLTGYVIGYCIGVILSLGFTMGLS